MKSLLWQYVSQTLSQSQLFTFYVQAREGKALKDPETKYYAELRDKLDLVLTFTENG